MKDRVFIVDDDPNIIKSLEKVLRLEGYHTEATENALSAPGILKNQNFSCILLDVQMPGMSGLELLSNILSFNPLIPVIMISGQSNIETAVGAIKDGAFDFIEKPIDPERLLITIRNAIQRERLQSENKYLSGELEENFRMVGKSVALFKILDDVKSVAVTDAKVLITGETGTGKELVAWAVHHNSSRKSKPYIKLNCASIPSELLESELFGHRKGSFTGAISDHTGKFRAADGGTLFLDEIGDMDLKLQAKMLRVLEEGEIDVIGEREPQRVDVRVISATNKNLEQLIENGSFREDLYHRLNVVRIEIPPLRQRQDDILPIAYHFLKLYNEKYNRQVLTMNHQVESFLLNYNWPGNVRELQHIIEKLIIFAGEHTITMKEIQKVIDQDIFCPSPVAVSGNDHEILDLNEAVENFKKQYIRHVYEKMDGKKQETARALGVHRSNLFRMMKTYGLE